MGVARSHLAERLSRPAQPRGPYRKPEDALLLPTIRAIVCDLMIACCERRFGATKAPHPVEWLSDNGAAYIAKETAQTAAALGLRRLFTPARVDGRPEIADGAGRRAAQERFQLREGPF